MAGSKTDNGVRFPSRGFSSLLRFESYVMLLSACDWTRPIHAPEPSALLAEKTKGVEPVPCRTGPTTQPRPFSMTGPSLWRI